MNQNYLEFEQSIADLDAKIEALRHADSIGDIDIHEEITRLQGKSLKLTESIFSNLSPWQISQLARHPQRPYTQDYIDLMLTDFQELHGDRLFADDHAIVAGLDRKSTRLNSSHTDISRMPSSA